MSGIVGIYHRTGEAVEAHLLSLMVDAIAHRGPDGTQIWHENNAGMGHLSLWTTPESMLERMPQCDRLSETTITADARIDNRDELIDVLGLKGDRAEKITDCSLILKAYYKWGENCPGKLIGDFAFAIWDARQQRWFCARSPVGIKPFYYYCSSTLFAFASEIKALLCLPQIAKELNELRVAYQLAGCLEDEEITFYKNIFRLRQAHSLIISRESKTSTRYWSLDTNRRIKLSCDREYAEAFKEIFTEAVRCRLRSAFGVGSTLSGGLDSSSITCTARNLLADSDRQLHTFSAIFPNLPKSELKWIDERRYMDVVKSKDGLISHDIRADLLNPLLDWFWQGDEPIAGTNMYIHQGMYDCANQQGVRVFLDGVDGDTTVSHGWRYLTNLTYTGRWQELYRELAASARNLRISRMLIAKTYCIQPFIHEPIAQIKQRLFPQHNYDELLARSFAKQTQVYNHIQRIASEPLFLTARKQHLAGMSTGLYPLAMEICDKTATPRAIEPRYPFFDRRLMEFCLAIPLEQKFQQGYARSVLRRAMEGILPTEVQWRTNKAKLGSNFQRNLLNHSQTLAKVMRNPDSIAPYVDLSKLKTIYHRYAVEKQPQPGDDVTMLNAATLALWLDRF